MAKLDSFQIGQFWTADKLKDSGNLTSPSLGTMYRLKHRTDKDAQDAGVLNTGAGDISNVFSVIDGGVVETLEQDLTNDIVDYYLTSTLRTLTLANPTVVDNRNITVVNDTDVVSGSLITIQEDMRIFQAKILALPGANVLVLDTPLDYAFTVGATISEGLDDASDLDGSGTVVIMELKPIAGTVLHINRFMYHMVHAGAGDDSTFGDALALTRGIIIRKANAVHHTIFNAKVNGNLRERGYDVVYSTKAGGGLHSTTLRRSINGPEYNGVVMKLDGDLGDSIQLVIQDDLGALTSISRIAMVAQGHIEIK